MRDRDSHLMSICTPIYDPDPQFLRESLASIQTQELPDLWALEWLLEEDSPTGQLSPFLPTLPWVLPELGTMRSIAEARSKALRRSRGILAKHFDYDNVLGPGALRRDILAFEKYPQIGWTASYALDLTPDGLEEPHIPPPTGLIPPGFILEYWLEHGYRFPIHPTTACYRYEALALRGGWPAIGPSDDTGAFLAITTLFPGYIHKEVGLHYRRWSGQITQSPAYTRPGELEERYEFLADMGRAMLALQSGNRPW